METDQETIARLEQRWPEYIKNARDGELDDRTLAKILRRFEHEDVSLRDGVCPDCGSAVGRDVDPRQAGPDLGKVGFWVRYWCGTQPGPGHRRDDNGCLFRLDRFEEVIL